MKDLRFELPELNTWRLCNKAVSAILVRQMVQRWEAEGYRFGAVTIDDGWQDGGLMGLWTPCPQRFPDPRGLVDWLHQRGYAVRLWLAPCQIHPGTPIFQQAWPDALLKDRSGKPSLYRGLGTYTLDIRTELARRHITDVMQQAWRQWGFDAVKLDFPPFYTPGDEFYRLRDFDLPEQDQQTMVGRFHELIRTALDGVDRAVRVESYPKCHGAAPFIQDLITGDLVGEDRSWERLHRLANKARDFIGDRDITPWFEMVWGEGDGPMSNPRWHVGFIEYVAASINFGFKIEHSFMPFDYPNARQIRALTNLYGPRDPHVRVLHAGRRTFDIRQLLDAGQKLAPQTRWLVAPEEDVAVQMHTAWLRTSAIDWRCRELFTGGDVSVRARNEFWIGDPRGCNIQFDARAGGVYELTYHGQATDYFLDLYEQHHRRSVAQREGSAGQ